MCPYVDGSVCIKIRCMANLHIRDKVRRMLGIKHGRQITLHFEKDELYDGYTGMVCISAGCRLYWREETVDSVFGGYLIHAFATRSKPFFSRYVSH